MKTSKISKTAVTLVMKSPFGPFVVEWDGAAVVRCGWRSGVRARAGGAVPKALKPLADYFRDGSGRVEDVPVRWDLLTPFQKKVARALQKVGRGETISYGELAGRVQSPRGARAVGTVMRTNPFPVMVPCHRVVQSGGGLGNFSAPGGSKTKARILAFEKRK